MLKKMMLLAISAAALVAFAVPATASAVSWTHKGEPITEKKTITLSGELESQSSAGASIKCPTHATATLLPGSTGSVTLDTVGPEKCKTNLEALGCKVVHVTNTSPWEIHAVEGGAITITNVSFTNHFAGPVGCPTTVTATGDLTAPVDTPEAISTVTFNKASGTLASGVNVVHILGSLAVTPAGTYGIE